VAQVYYPIALDVDDRRCLVVGGGAIATDKVDGLLKGGALVSVVSPVVSEKLNILAEDHCVSWQQRPYQTKDLERVFLVIAATDRVEVNAQIASEARSRGILVNAVDDPPNCDFFAMSLLRRGDLQLAISTNGRSPAFARWLRERLEKTLPEEYGELLAVLAEVRDEVRLSGPIPPYEHWEIAITEEVLARVREGNLEEAKALVWQAIKAAQEEPERGRVEPSLRVVPRVAETVA
jgi:precorrin-2 dehydrogenase / sirohydrochlorin ferrochelatase